MDEKMLLECFTGTRIFDETLDCNMGKLLGK